MNLRKQTRRGRGGFTLIELLVVIAIIAVLVSLTAAAVFRVLGAGARTQARTDIGQLDTGLASVRTEFGLSKPIPSFLVLREDGKYDTANNPYHRQTVSLLKKMFGRRFNPLQPRDWNGNGKIDAPPLYAPFNTAPFTPGDLVLEGHHCLVFFLGGIPTPPGGTDACTGFSADPLNPDKPTSMEPQGTPRRGPWFEFKSSRLKRDPRNGFLYYTDPFSSDMPMPYAYFASTNGNDYGNHCPSLGLLPYTDVSTPPRFINPNGHQIISAGPDGQFGPGGPWDPVNGALQGPTADNLANFSGRQLGAGAS